MIRNAALHEDPVKNGAAPDRPEPRRMLGLPEVLQIVPISPVTLWRLEKKGLFPRGTFISPNKKIWFCDEIIAWQREVDGRRRGRQNHPDDGSKR